MMKVFSLPLLTSLLFSTSTLMATDMKPLFQLGYDFGGTTLATIEQYDYYDGYQTTKIRAGQGLNFALGASIESASNDLELQFLVGYKFDEESSANGSVNWDRIPFTALAMVKKNKWKFGGGITYHLNPRISGGFSGYDENNVYFNDSVDDRYENSVGGVVQIEYQLSEAMSLGIKGTFIEYKLQNDTSVIANGNSVGINFSYAFGETSEFR